MKTQLKGICTVLPRTIVERFKLKERDELTAILYDGENGDLHLIISPLGGNDDFEGRKTFEMLHIAVGLMLDEVPETADEEISVLETRLELMKAARDEKGT